MSMTLWVSVTALLFAIGALFVACLSLHLSRSNSAARQSARLTEIESMIEALSLAVRNVRSRLNMAAYRAKRRESTEPIDDEPPQAPNGADAAEIRARLNRQLAEKMGG